MTLKSLLYSLLETKFPLQIENIVLEGDKDWEKVSDENGVRAVASGAKSAIVTLKNTEEKLLLFIKTCLKGTTAEHLNNSLKIFERESLFYGEILPALIKFEESEKDYQLSSLSLKPLFLDYFGTAEEDGSHYIVLRKFSSSDFFITKAEEFHTLSQIKLCMKSIALYHATTYCMHKMGKFNWSKHKLAKDMLFDRSTFDVVGSYFNGYHKGTLKVLQAMKQEIKKKNDLVKDCILSFNSLNTKVLDRLEKLEPYVTDILRNTLDCPGELCVLTHGDFHMWNVAFSNKGELDVIFFDFQLIRFTSGLVDIHHFLSQVCTPATRNKHLPEFLKEYHDVFNETCCAFGVESNVYTMETINREYMLRSAWGFFFGFLFILPRFVSKDFYSLLEEKENSSDIIDLLVEKGSKNVLSVLEMYVDMVQIEDDLGTIELMEKLAFTPRDEM